MKARVLKWVAAALIVGAVSAGAGAMVENQAGVFWSLVVRFLVIFFVVMALAPIFAKR